MNTKIDKDSWDAGFRAGYYAEKPGNDFGFEKASFASFEGYIAARVLVEGLKKAGKKLSRESLVDALGALTAIDLSGHKLAYSATDHGGSKLVELTIISGPNTFRR